MTPNTLFPGRPNYTGPTKGYFGLLHHDQLFEWSDNVLERVAYVKKNKPIAEQAIRLHNMIYINFPDLDKAINSEINPLIPAGFKSTSVEIGNLNVKKTTSDTSQISVSVIVKTIPQIDSQEVAKNIAGKNLENARKYLQALPAIAKIDFKITPSLPIITSRLPFRSGRIEVLICEEQCL